MCAIVRRPWKEDAGCMVACLIVGRSWKEGAGSERIYVQGQGSQGKGVNV